LTSLGQLGFRRYKAPLVNFFDEQINQEGYLSNYTRSLERFWKFCLNEDSEAYARKTKETKADREESVFFDHMKRQSEEWKAYKIEWRALGKELANERKEAYRKDARTFQQFAQRMRKKEKSYRRITKAREKKKEQEGSSSSGGGKTKGVFGSLISRSPLGPKRKEKKEKKEKGGVDDDGGE